MTAKKITALIADDEPLIISLIKKLGCWDELNIEIISTVTNGQSAFSFILENKPDIVIIDIRMPGMEGIEVVKECRERGINSKFIIVSGYQEFTYAQQGIAYRVLDYLVKPINKTALNHALEKACSELSAQENHQKEHETLSRQFFTLLGNGDTSSPEYKSLLANYHSRFSNKYFRILITKIDYQPSETSTDYHSVCFENVKEHLSDILSSKSVDFELSADDAQLLCILNYNNIDEYRFLTELGSSATALNHSVKRFGDCSVTCCISTQTEDIYSIPVIYKEALMCMEYRRLFGNSGRLIIYNQDIGRVFDNIGSTALSLAEKERLYHIFETQNEVDLNNFLTELSKSGSHDIQRFLRLKAFTALFFEIASGFDYCCDDIEADNQKAFSMIRNTVNVNTLFSVLGQHIMTVFTKIIDSKAYWNDRHIRAAKHYIETHYREAIQLEDIADAIGLNANYLSSLFKQKTGIKFSQYLQHVRISNAKEMLASTNYTVREISETVGYADIKYFSRLFRENVGVTPSTYQKIHSKIDT